MATIKDVSSLLCVKESTLYSWVHNGTIPYHKLNGLVRFDLDEVENWIKAARTASPVPEIVPAQRPNQSIDKIIRQAIDGTKGKAYNSSNGKPGQIQGLRKE